MDTPETRPAAAPPVPKPVASAASSTADVPAVIDKWFADSFQGTRLGNDTETWNLVFRAKEDLKTRLAR
jgi:hypothetical protein